MQGVSQQEALEVRKQCENVFRCLKMHPSVALFVQPPDFNDPHFHQMLMENPDFLNLTQIEMNFA